MAAQGDEQTEPLRLTPDGTSPWVLDGRYRMVRRLGAGATADVFIAHDQRLDREVAIKVFRALLDDADDGAQRRQLHLAALARLSHPNLVALLDAYLGPRAQPYLALELVDGPNLAGLLRDGPLPEPEVRLIGSQVADALSYAHAQGMAHRDVKPTNILLGSDGPDGAMRARLSDFGTVRLVGGARLTAPEIMDGPATYLAPEQAHGDDAGPKADIYSLGLVLIEALTGRRCFPGSLHESLAARRSTSPTIPDTLSQPWPKLLAAMTAPDPAVRPDAAEVADILHTEAVPPTPIRRRVEPPRLMPSLLAVSAAAGGDPVADTSDAHTSRPGQHTWVLMAALVVAALAAGAAVVLSGQHGRSAVDDAPPISPGAQHTSRPASSIARHTSPAEVVNTHFDAPVAVASPHMRTSRTAAAASHRRQAPAPRPAAPAPATTAGSRAPSATTSGSTPTSAPASSSPSPTPTPSPPTSVSPSPTPPPSP